MENKCKLILNISFSLKDSHIPANDFELQTRFYLQNPITGLVLSYDENNYGLTAFEPMGVAQQLWEYSGQVLYNDLAK